MEEAGGLERLLAEYPNLGTAVCALEAAQNEGRLDWREAVPAQRLQVQEQSCWVQHQLGSWA